MSRMELVDRYIDAVGRRLPDKMRGDVELELKSLIMDTLEDRTRDAGGPSVEDLIAVLRELGSPADVAARYAPPRRYLIGPELYQAYLTVVGIVVGAVTLGITISHVVGFIGDPPSMGEAILRILLDVLAAGISAFGSVTLAFAVMERLLPDEGKEGILAIRGEWDPRKLPPVQPKESAVRLSDPVASLVFTVAAIVIFNLFARQAGPTHPADSFWHFASMFQSETIARFLPYWNALWVVGLIHQIILLVRREWSVPSRLLEIALSASGTVLLGFMAGAAWVRPEGFLALGGEASAGDLTKLANLVAGVLRMALVVSALVGAVETVRQIVKLIQSMAARSERLAP